MTVNITDTAITKATADAKTKNSRIELIDAGCEGLHLRITPSGKRTWSLYCRDQAGRLRRYTLGSHPQMGISEARTVARTNKDAVQLKGADPTAARRQARNAKLGMTLADLICEYEQNGNKPEKSWRENKRRIETVFKPLLSRKVKELQQEDYIKIVDVYKAKYSAAAAVRYIRPILKWANIRKYVDKSVIEISTDIKVKKRNRNLSSEELQLVLKSIGNSTNPYWQAMHFLLLTLARKEEVAKAKWADINFSAKTWQLHNTKNGEDFEVLLSPQALELLHKRRTLNPAGEGYVFCNKNGGKLTNWDRETKKLFTDSGTHSWHRHDLRRTSATIAGKVFGMPPYVIKSALNHKDLLNSEESIYNLSRYETDVRELVDKIGLHYEKIILNN